MAKRTSGAKALKPARARKPTTKRATGIVTSDNFEAMLIASATQAYPEIAEELMEPRVVSPKR